ncbi:MAG: hypothetical protein KF716_01515 [Anaerolineae bacterium]|nr:hypothetical protein [Anaerolineae bacterium]
MLNLNSIDNLLETIENTPDDPVLNVSFHFSARVAVETRYVGRFGVIGVVAFAYSVNGDQLALRFLPGQPIANWPVVRVSHVGEGCRTISSRLSRLMPAILQIDTPLQHQQALKIYSEKVLKYSAWLGDSEGITQALIDDLRDETADMFTALPHLPFSRADPDSVLALFDAAYERALNDPTDLAERWREVIHKDALFAPAQMLHFKALLAGNDATAIRRSAWDVLSLNHAIDNVYMVERVRHPEFGWPDENPVIVAAQTLLERGLPPMAESLSTAFTPVIEGLANDEESYDGTAHLEASRQLYAQKDYQHAYTASQNAVYWRNIAQEAAYPEALTFAVTVARDWQQPELVRSLELAQEKPAPDKTETAAPSISAPNNRVLPRDVELSPQAKAFLDQLASGEMAYVSGDWILIYRHQRWNWLSQGYVGGDKIVTTLAVLTSQKLVNVISTIPPEEFASHIVSVTELPEKIQQELRFKLLPDVDDYHYLIDQKHMSITGGATTEDTVNPQHELEARCDLTRSILTSRGGGWFKFWATWQEIEQALNERPQ